MQIVELSYPILGSSLPADNGYPLYSAVSRHLGGHLPDGISLASVGGLVASSGRILVSRRSQLRLRTPCETIGLLLGLAGARLNVGGHEILLGVPRVLPLDYSSTLKSRLVAIKGYTVPEIFLEAAERQLRRICSSGKVSIPTLSQGRRAGLPQRRVLQIKDRTIVGFGVLVQDLEPEDCTSLLVYGLGGRRHMGCGIFVPVRDGRSRS
jgi:CRISPR-associated protein Cas6